MPRIMAIIPKGKKSRKRPPMRIADVSATSPTAAVSHPSRRYLTKDSNRGFFTSSPRIQLRVEKSPN